jgi:putative transposase
MPKGLERRYGQIHLHCITFSYYRRLPLLQSIHARNLFVETLGELRARHDFLVVGYVVMPEHVHLLLGEPRIGTPSTLILALKQRVSRQLRCVRSRARANSRAIATRKPLPHFWQHRFYDFNVWTQRKKNEKLHYMHNNPIQRGLVTQPKDWPWSSNRFYAHGGEVLLSLDTVD